MAACWQSVSVSQLDGSYLQTFDNLSESVRSAMSDPVHSSENAQVQELFAEMLLHIRGPVKSLCDQKWSWVCNELSPDPEFLELLLFSSVQLLNEIKGTFWNTSHLKDIDTDMDCVLEWKEATLFHGH